MKKKHTWQHFKSVTLCFKNHCIIILYMFLRCLLIFCYGKLETLGVLEAVIKIGTHCVHVAGRNSD